jgi:hypothetical protein
MRSYPPSLHIMLLEQTIAEAFGVLNPRRTHSDDFICDLDYFLSF